MPTFSQLESAASVDGEEFLAISKLSASVTITANTISAQASDNSFNDSGDGFISAGFEVGRQVKITGFTGDTANNIFSATVTAVAAGKLTVAGSDGDVIVDDAAGESVTITQWQSYKVTSQEVGDLGGTGDGSSQDDYGTASISSGSIDLSDNTKNAWIVNLTENVTSITLPSASSGKTLSLLIFFIQDGTGGRTVSGWPSMSWEAGSAPTVESSANEVTSVPIVIFGDSAGIFGVS